MSSDAFAPLIAPLANLALSLAHLFMVLGFIAIIVLIGINIWSILNPRAGMAVKGDALKVIISVMLLGLAGTIWTITQAAFGTAGG